MNNSLGIIIVNFNSGKLLKNCIDSIFNSDISKISLRVVIVDNNSKDDSLDIARKQDGQLKIIKNKQNKGFGKACNQGSELLFDKDFLLILNPDTIIEKQSLVQSLKFLIKNKNVSILGACHLNEFNNISPSCSRTPTVTTIIWDILGLSKLFPWLFKPATVMTDFDHKSSCYVNQVMGAYMMMQRKIFEDLKGFDTRFFVYYEDADFAYRAKKIGYNTYYNSDIRITHIGRGTTAKISDKSLFYNLRSRIQFVNKHYGAFKGNIILFMTLTIEPITRILYNLIKNPEENKNTIKAIRSIYRYYFKI